MGHKIYQRLNLLNDIREVGDIGWFNFQYVKLFNNESNNLENIIRSSFKITKKYQKNKQSFYF